jgi:hypothetical protein
VLKIIERGRNKKIKDALETGEEIKLRTQTPGFIYVEDRIIANAMRKHWGIVTVLGGKKKAAFGLKTHSWQALGLASYFIVREKINFSCD